MKPSIDTLKTSLTKLEISYNFAKTRLKLSKSTRNYKALASFFGIKIQDEVLGNKFAFLNELEIFKNQIESIIKDKYASRNYLQRGSKETVNGSNTTELLGKTEVLQEDDNSSNRKDSNWIAKYPDQKAELMVKYCNQQRVAKAMWDAIDNGMTGLYLIATTGSGKTFIIASLIKNFIKQNWVKRLGSLSPWPIVYITKATVVQQTEEVLRDKFGIDCIKDVHVINIELLRTKLGKLFISEKVSIDEGVEKLVYSWNPLMHPVLFIWDEGHILARDVAMQTKIAQGASEIIMQYGVPIIQIFASATPATRVCEFKTFGIATLKEFEYGLQRIKLTSRTWNTFTNQICNDPYEYNDAAVKRCVDFFESNIFRIKGIRPQHRAFNSVKKIYFETDEERAEYQKAWDDYLEKKAKIEGNEKLSNAQNRFMLLAQFTIFRKAAEKIRRHHLAEFAVKSWEVGKAPGIACAFKSTITSIYRILIEDYGWKREDISLIWGGSNESLSDKAKIAKRFKEHPEFEQALALLKLRPEDLGLVNDVSSYNIKNDEQLEFERQHKLLTQKIEDREYERMRFQRQDSRLIMFTYKAGGVGLSAHHESFYPKARPREGRFTPVYSEKELIQAFGRLPRITSISDTYQCMCYYGGTIEDKVASRVTAKLKCAKEVVKIREHWEDLIGGSAMADNLLEDEDEGDEQAEAEQLGLMGEFVEE